MKSPLRSERAKEVALPGQVSRRDMLLSTGATSFAALAVFRVAHGIEGDGKPAMDSSKGMVNKELPVAPEMQSAAPSTVTSTLGFQKDNDQANVMRRYAHVHEGKGAIDIKVFFEHAQAAKPGVFLIYTIPPGSSEGVHVHKPGDAELGSFDEFYYIISGHGEMEIDGQKVAVKAGDHVLTPNGVPHGIENTSAEADLKVYLLAMVRD